MQSWTWVANHWFEVLNALGIVGGLLFTAISFRSDTKSQRIANLLTITSNHRDIWQEFSRRPELKRVLDTSVDLVKHPISPAEKEFINFVILHLSSVYYAMKDEIVTKMGGMRRDVGSFFSLPLPQAMWEQSKVLQNDDFIAFVEDCKKCKSGL